jgi:hypothetical protein
MAKVVSEHNVEASTDKWVELKTTSVMEDADGNEVSVVDFKETMLVDSAIEIAENKKADLEAQLTEVNQEITDLIAIRDAE